MERMGRLGQKFGRLGSSRKMEKTAGDREPEPEPAAAPGGGGWGGWGFSISSLQKAAEEISRNAAAAAQTAAKGIAEIVEGSDSSNEGERGESVGEKESDDEDERIRKAALEKLENASADSFLGERLKVIDSSVENFASGAWQALGSAIKGSSDWVQRLENSAANLADSIQQGGLPVPAGSVKPSLLETGKALTSKGIEVLEFVGKETMDLLITETGIEVEKKSEAAREEADEGELFEEVSFDRCFYIYGGPEQLEELEALSSHYSLLSNRRKAKLSSEQKSLYEGKLREVQQIFDMNTEIDGTAKSDKGKKIETETKGEVDEIKMLHDSSVSKAADMAAGFANALAGLAVNDIVQRTAGRLDSLHSEGIHRLSELCCAAVCQLLILGKSIIADANKAQDGDANEDMMRINWPEDASEKAKIIRSKAQSMIGSVEAVSHSFITGITDVTEAYQAAMKGAAADSHSVPQKVSVPEKVSAFSDHIRADQATAVSKIQDGLQYLAYLVTSTSMPSSA